MNDFVIAGPRHALLPQLSLLRRIYLPRTADAAAFAMSTYGIPLIVLATTRSATLTGIAFALEWVPRLAAFSLAGQVVDRHGTKRVFRIASVLRALVVVAAAFILPSQAGGTGATVTVMALAAITGVVTEFSYIAAETAGATASKDAGDRAHRVQSVLLGIDQTATLAGPALAGFLLHWVGVTGTLLTMAGCSLLGALLAPWHREARLVPPPAPALAGLRTGWKTLVSLPALAWLITGLTVSNIATGFLQAAAPIIVVQHLGQSSAAVGVIWSAAAAASLLAVALCRVIIDRLGLWPAGAASAAVAALAGLAVSLAGDYTHFLILTAVLMAGEGGMTVVLRTLRSHLIPEPVFGATLAVTILVMLLPFPLAGILVALTPAAVLGHVLTACACLQAVGLTAAFWRLRREPAMRVRRTAHTAPPTGAPQPQ
ncbi:MFS transporter [Streptomyces sp. NPDC048577]|uniref:MFS transporter n=1 Tax=Streptomyces sp. NPDC048577 TaxID=3157209 RepID=UPI00343B3CB4